MRRRKRSWDRQAVEERERDVLTGEDVGVLLKDLLPGRLVDRRRVPQGAPHRQVVTAIGVPAAGGKG